MAGEFMVPLLPCASVDEIRDFYLPLGFEMTYRQVRPYPYVALKREGIDLHYFGMDGFKPEDSYGTCLVVVKDPEPLFDAFAAGLRAQFGKLPLTGFPRITRPRRRKNAGGLSGFSLVDPAGNWIRVTVQTSDEDAADPAAKPDRLARAFADAVVFADSKGDVEQAASILSRALVRSEPDTDAAGWVEAAAYLAELHVRCGETERAAALLTEIESFEMSDADRERAARALADAAELRSSLNIEPTLGR